MRMAVFSDVHGNLTALEAILSDIAVQQVDSAVFAGDACFLGPRPADCLARMRTSGVVAIYGNTDDWILGRQQPHENLAALVDWTRSQIDSTLHGWLEQLPFSYTVSPNARQEDSLLIVHANPMDVNQVIFPPEEDQLTRYGEIRQSDDDLEAMLPTVAHSHVIFGHIHIPFVRTVKKIRLYNISSASIPGDADPRAKYGLFNWSGEAWSFEHRYVEYDMTPEIAAYRSNQPPDWQRFADTITNYGFIPQNV